MFIFKHNYPPLVNAKKSYSKKS